MGVILLLTIVCIKIIRVTDILYRIGGRFERGSGKVSEKIPRDPKTAAGRLAGMVG
jgi:hypothetical protein